MKGQRAEGNGQREVKGPKGKGPGPKGRVLRSGRRLFCLSSLFLPFALCPLPFALACSAPQTRFLSIATGGTGGVYYPYGGALARVISEQLPGTQATAEVTG